jgi:hypothetical protein
MGVLVIVDMQPAYEASNRCMQSVLELTKKSMDHGLTIVVLELSPGYNKPTHTEITDLLKGYEKVLTVTKTSDNGAEEIRAALQSTEVGRKAKLDKFRLCGVNANCCVRATALGLANNYADCEIIVHFEACCGTSLQMQSSFRSSDWYWHSQHQYRNLYLSKGGRLYHYQHELVQPEKAA